MDKYKTTDIALDRPLYQIYSDKPNDRDLITKVREAIARISNTITRPDTKNKSPQQIELELNGYADQLISRILEMNETFAHNPEVLKLTIFRMVEALINKLVAVAKTIDPEDRLKRLVSFEIDFFDRMHF